MANRVQLTACDCVLNVTYAGRTYIRLSPSNTTVVEGTRVTLACHAEASHHNITYQWYRGDVNVQLISSRQHDNDDHDNHDHDHDDHDDHDDFAGRLSVYPDGSLVINSVRRTDSGWYKCRPGTGLALPSEAAAFLNVTCK